MTPQERLRSAFREIAEARRDMTIWEFERYARDELCAGMGRGFIASIGTALFRASEASYRTAGMEHTATQSGTSGENISQDRTE